MASSLDKLIIYCAGNGTEMHKYLAEMMGPELSQE